jgi:hypothetical protein
VGRDELCLAVLADLQDRQAPPRVLVGGIGTGKTAVLVRLTELLAEKNLIPVPVRLRDASTFLDFEELARDRFLSEVNPALDSSEEGETIWRRLRKDRKIVVLADGLDDALIGTSAEPERDNIIRTAIRRAHLQQLPLVIASRPHDLLGGAEAATLILGPLSYQAALAYVALGGTSEQERRLAWIVETADVVEAPTYLAITRELRLIGLLEPTSALHQGKVDARGMDRTKLRLTLLETWERALTHGYLWPEVPLSRAERQAAVELVSALACVGLRADRSEAEFDDDPGAQIAAEVQQRLARIDEQAGRPGVRTVDVRLAAAWAAQLDLVELRGNGVRFPDSLMQAYLGSRLLDAALLDPDYLSFATQYPGPGRELLLALALHSRAAEPTSAPQPDVGRQAGRGPRPARKVGVPSGRNDSAAVQVLRQAAARRFDNMALDMYAAAFEIDCVAAEPAHSDIAKEIAGVWPLVHA